MKKNSTSQKKSGRPRGDNLCPNCRKRSRATKDGVARAYCSECSRSASHYHYHNSYGPRKSFNWQGTRLGSVYGAIEKSAKKRGYSFNVSRELFLDLSQRLCHYCGDVPASGGYKNSRGKNIGTYNGLDRTDNTLGYEPDNVVPCCKVCNRMKSEMPVEDWLVKMEHILLNMQNVG